MPESYLPLEDDGPTALEMFEAEMKPRKVRQESISQPALNDAIRLISDTLGTGWTTGGGRRLQQFVWSLWNQHHWINLYDLAHGLDDALTDAVILVFRAAMVGVLTEDQLRQILTDSGELVRWDECRRITPQDEDVLYPPLPLSAEDLMALAIAAQRHTERSRKKRRQVSDS
jgi:hypothetical protein